MLCYNMLHQGRLGWHVQSGAIYMSLDMSGYSTMIRICFVRLDYRHSRTQHEIWHSETLHFVNTEYLCLPPQFEEYNG